MVKPGLHINEFECAYCGCVAEFPLHVGFLDGELSVTSYIDAPCSVCSGDEWVRISDEQSLHEGFVDEIKSGRLALMSDYRDEQTFTTSI